MYSKEQENVAGSSQNTSDPSNLFSDISALNKARAKSKTEEEKEYFISVITSELPSLLHHLTAPELPKTSDDERFIQFMRFLEEHKVSDALQNVAETAISKLLETAGKRMSQEENIDPRIRKALESQSPEKLTFQKAFSDLSKILAKPNMLSSIGQEVSYVNPSEFSDKRYSEFLHLLEEKQIFASLQNVVDEAVNRLLNVVKEEEASSELDTSSQPKNKNNHAKTKKIQFT
uniref:Uncharacterized protein LOC117365286 isoform X2 n=1 Tax=Geotrypetes seraphini TaxID=260995 RepID=A0A6P8S224_GEOSA|nr:uncharacterized protein LOC117365286 isoform X2 [Geotrypetes seraphini]XP_033811418.1 uncharacterized protein LOC117365286 isoform X2 [Geotrypetes seraphini]